MKKIISMLLLALAMSTACDKKQDIDVVWSPPASTSSAADSEDISYRVFYHIGDRQFSDSSFVATQDTVVTLMFEVTKPTMLYLKVVAVDSVGNVGLPMYQEVKL